MSSLLLQPGCARGHLSHAGSPHCWSTLSQGTAVSVPSALSALGNQLIYFFFLPHLVFTFLRSGPTCRAGSTCCSEKSQMLQFTYANSAAPMA